MSINSDQRAQGPFAFWWQCMRIGARGTSPFANDWQWAIGNPTIAAISPAILAGLVTWLGKDYVAAEHPVLGPVAIAFGAYVVTWVVGVVGRTLNAAPRIYYQEKHRADDLARQFEPKISVHDGSVMEYPYIDRATGVEGVSKWVQITVRSATKAPLVDCEARLTTVHRIKDDDTLELIEREPLFCGWSGLSEARITIPPGISQSANLFSAYEGSDQLKLEIRPPKLRIGSEIQKPGRYRLGVSVTAKDTPPISRNYRFEWDGTFQHITLRPEN
jgi:hypothetical protein